MSKGTIIKPVSSFIKDSYRFLQATVFGTGDDKNIKQLTPHGFNCNPPKNGIAVTIDTQNDAHPVVIGFMNKDAIELLQGESVLFVTDDQNNVLFKLHFKNDGGTGKAVFDEGTYSSTRFEELETAFNQLKSDFDSLAQKYNTQTTHTHLAPSGGTGPPLPTEQTQPASTADVSNAKSDTVLIP